MQSAWGNRGAGGNTRGGGGGGGQGGNGGARGGTQGAGGRGGDRGGRGGDRGGRGGARGGGRGEVPSSAASSNGHPAQAQDNQPPPKAQGRNPEGGDQKARPPRPPPSNEICTAPQTIIDAPSAKQGNTGTILKLKANYFSLLSAADWILYQYHVDFMPEIEQTFVKKAMVRQKREEFGAYLFDGTNIYTNKMLSNDVTKVLEYTSIREEDKTAVIMKVKLVGDVMKGDYHYLQIFNILMRRCLEMLNLQLIGRNYFDAAAKVNIKDYHLDIWPGYSTSIRQHDGGIFMNVEVTHKVMRTQTALGLLEDLFNKSRQNYQNLFKNEIIGTVVLTDYNNKTYKIDDVDFDMTPSMTFDRKGQPITYAAYYNERYRIRINDMRQPLLVSKAKARDRRAGAPEYFYLIPELCRLTGLTDQMRSNFHLMSALATHTRVAPDHRVTTLMRFNDRLRQTPEVGDDLKRWNFGLSKTLVELKGRQLMTEQIRYGSAKIATVKGDFTNTVINQKAVKSVPITDWACVLPARDLDGAKKFIDQMISFAAKMGFQFARPKVLKPLNEDRVEYYIQALEDITSKGNPQLVMCIVPNNQTQRYNAIKKKLCCDRPVPCQVVLSKNVKHHKPNMFATICTKVAIQCHAKVGGIPWSVTFPPEVRGLMVVGYDVSRVKEKKECISYGAMVASLDQDFGHYYSAISRHNQGQELSDSLTNQLFNALQVFKAQNMNRLPSRIILYRDGVGEGDLNFVYEYEVERIKKMLTDVYEGPGWKLAVTIVTKRINTRIFAENNTNPSPGTVVDSVITDPLKYDFFIVSQSVRQGTVAPTAYNIISDNTGLSVNAMQALAFKFCHMYFNLSNTIRVPAPCQYAHKLALLVTTALDAQPSPQLQKLLYFL